MGCALGHHSSQFRRFGAIFGVPNAYRELSFDLSCQTFHQMPLRLSPVSSRDLALSGLLCACRQRRCGGAATPTPTAPKARSGGMYSDNTRARTVGPLKALGDRPRGRSLRWIRTSAAAQNPWSPDQVRRWRRGSPGCKLCSLAP